MFIFTHNDMSLWFKLISLMVNDASLPSVYSLVKCLFIYFVCFLVGRFVYSNAALWNLGVSLACVSCIYFLPVYNCFLSFFTEYFPNQKFCIFMRYIFITFFCYGLSFCFFSSEILCLILNSKRFSCIWLTNCPNDRCLRIIYFFLSWIALTLLPEISCRLIFC